MSEQDRYIAGVPCWVDTTQPDARSATAFYGALFGWDFEDATPPGSPGSYSIARLRGEDVAAVGSAPPEAGPPTAAWNTYVWVQDADETAAKVRDAGGTVVLEPVDIGAAGRMALCADPAGAAFSIWQAKAHRGAAIVNEHASVNFNILNTRDLERATAFYGAVFGWELIEVGEGSMWALAAYGDFLEQRTPGMRENMASMGAPARFEDVVAGVSPISDDQPEHWGVTFAVDDADTIAARAAELGGRVLVAPCDAPWVRMTVISDPQGATFTASQFVPENKALAQSSSTATAG
jgi:predicted enzyme related to lactoylglutathione lyase